MSWFSDKLRRFGGDGDWNSPSHDQVVITPDDNNNITGGMVRSVSVTADCVLKITNAAGQDRTVQFFKGYNPIPCTKIFATGSTLNGAVINGHR